MNCFFFLKVCSNIAAIRAFSKGERKIFIHDGFSRSKPADPMLETTLNRLAVTQR